MIATFAIKLMLAAYVFVRYRVTRFGQVAAGVFILLATFQIADFRICTTSDASALLWSRVGFVAITILPKE